ncbi:MAG TPA: family 16 glycoside hydrolase, partial [Anaerolineales bacterium]|nr:family 16 glycoside hydrolase [Anaerolineales bacterium]
QEIEKTGAAKPIKRTDPAIARPTQSAPAFGAFSTPRRPSQTTRLLRQAWWALPLVGLATIIALVVIAIIGAVIIGAIPRPTPIVLVSAPAAATESGGATESSTPPSSPVAAATESPPTLVSTPTNPPGATLLEENFEGGDLDDWIAIHGKIEVTQLPDGNHVLQMVKDQAEGAQALFAPSFNWPTSNYALEADVMAADLSPGATQVQLQTRVQAADVYQACLYYAGVLGDGWVSLERQFVNGGTCDDSLWETDYLAPSQGGTLEPNNWYHLRLEVFDNSVRYFLDGDLVLSGVDLAGAYGEGGVGLGMFHTSAAYFDNVRVERLEAPPE